VSIDPATSRAHLAALQRGDGAALDRLIEEWKRPLTRFAFRYVQNSADAHDLVAETFVKLYQRRLALRPETNLSAWLFTTLTNLCHNHHRWRRRHPTVPLDPPDEGRDAAGRRSPASVQLADGGPGPDALLAQDESLAAVQRAIDELPHELKATILLHHYEHLSYREIAGITGCSERGVETRLYRARQLLRKGLAGFFREVAED
jgi:RNA polymerase sigma-70 factor (ECF subfamily)